MSIHFTSWIDSTPALLICCFDSVFIEFIYHCVKVISPSQQPYRYCFAFTPHQTDFVPILALCPQKFQSGLIITNENSHTFNLAPVVSITP